MPPAGIRFVVARILLAAALTSIWGYSSVNHSVDDGIPEIGGRHAEDRMCRDGSHQPLESNETRSNFFQHQRNSTVAIQTIVIGSPKPYVQTVVRNHMIYCALHGYDCIFVREKLVERAPTWQKIPATLQLMDLGYEYVVLVDSDAVFANFSRSLDHFFDQMREENCTSWLFPGDPFWAINAGQQIFRNTPISRWILNSVHNLYYPGFDDQQGGLRDQAAFSAFLGGATEAERENVSKSKQRAWCETPPIEEGTKENYCERGDRRALDFVSHDISRHISYVPQRAINSYQKNYEEGDLLFHCAGIKNKQRCINGLSERAPIGSLVRLSLS